MSQNQEIIESKLCAYIDGELDSEGRAEIEKHLESNPQHRRLLESLRATRDLIRWLPREPAPPEVAETLSGQLERSVLLNYEGDSLRTNVWPRVFAAAAIILLTLGLGAAVYYALSRSQKPAQLAMHSPGNEPNAGDIVPVPATADSKIASTLDAEHGLERETDKMKRGPDEMKKDVIALDEKLPDDSGPPSGAMAKNGEAPPISKELDQLAEQVGQNPTAFLASAQNSNNAVAQNAAPANYNAMVVLVRSDAPEQTERQLTRYFSQQQIQWRQPPVGQAAGLALQQPQRGLADSNNDGGKRSEVAAKGARPGEPPAAPPALASSATTQPAKNESLNDAQNLIASQQVAGAFGNEARANYVYVCQMSRRQAEQLTNTIGNDAVPGNQVQNVNGMSYNAYLDRSATQNTPLGDQAQGGLVAQGGINRMAGGRDRIMMKAMPQTQPAVAMRQEIASNLQASATTPQSAIAPANAPNTSTDFSLRPKAGAQVASTQPGAIPGDARQAVAAATQPAQSAIAATEPSDEPLNVVIMVQPNLPATAATESPAPAPATQSSSNPLPQKAQAVPQQRPPVK